MDENVSKAKEVLTLQADRFQMKTMADFVREYLIAYSEEHPEFSEKILDPAKSFAGCIKDIKSHALKWLREQPNNEMVEGERDGVSGDVPNDICYGWAIDYYTAVTVPKPEPVVRNIESAKKKDAGKKSAKSGAQAEAFADDGKDHADTPGAKVSASEQLSLLGL